MFERYKKWLRRWWFGWPELQAPTTPIRFPSEWMVELLKRRPMCAQEEHDACACAQRLLNYAALQSKRSIARDLLEAK